MAREPQMNQRPQMPDMAGANMPRQSGDGPPVDRKTADAAQKNIMQPSAQLAAVLVSRLGAMTEQQLDELDRAISPAAAKALLILLPELGSLMEAMSGGDAAPAGPQAPRPQAPRPQAAPQAPRPQAGPQMGALGGMT
jgi:hypothetical protein